MGKRIEHFIDTYVVFDLETTGLSCYEHEIIEIGAIKVENNRVVDTYSSFVKPKNNIPYYITRINGISNQMVRNAPGIDSALTEFLEFTGEYPLLGHNIISFDMKFINVVSKDLYGAGVHNDYIDTLLLSRQHLRNIKSHSLSSLCQYFDIDTSGAHRALADSEMTNGIYQKLRKLHKQHRADKVERAILKDS
ncbi:MAG: 3'-5' exonuclease [Mobilitalea sp.]